MEFHGLKGIEAVRKDRYIRPLIECEREEIESYCMKKHLHPKIDQTNFDNQYTRNRVRNELIPYIKENFNPNIIEAVFKMANTVSLEDEYIENQVKKAYERILERKEENQISLDLKKFNELELVIKNRIVIYTITMLFGTSSGIEKIHIQDIVKLCQRNIGNKFLIPNKKIKISIKNHKIFFIKNR